MTRKRSTWSVLSRYVVAWARRLVLALLVAACSGLLLSACGGTDSLAPVGKQGKARHGSPALYRVRAGDTLYSIAFQYGKDYRRLARWNGIRAPYTIYVGQQLRLKPGKTVARTTTRPRTPTKQAKTTGKTARSTAKKPPVQSRKQNKSTTRTTSRHSDKGLVKGRIRWQWPSNGMIIEKFSAKSAISKGVDLSGRLGQAVRATAGGRVVYSGSGLRGYGRLIIVKHNEDFLSAYAHNRKLLVKEGEVVRQGQKIAEMGRSGTDRVKLHFEIRKDGNPVDPLRYLPKRRG